MSNVGQAFAAPWLEIASGHEIRILLESRPRIPPLIDSELIHTGEQSLRISLRGNQESRPQIRGSFWAIVSKYMKHG